MKDLNDVVEKAEGIKNDMNNVIVPILKDTIKDCQRQNTRLFAIVLAELIVILVMSVFIYLQNESYKDFLNEFDYESTETTYQDVDSGEGGIITNTILNK